MLNEVCDYGRYISLSLPYAQAVDVAKEALKREGFGVLCEIDVAKTLKEKTGAVVDPYVILGACNPTLARRALDAEPNLGLLLPCNVVVRQGRNATLVGAIDARRMLGFVANPKLEPIAAEVSERLDRVLDRLNAQV